MTSILCLAHYCDVHGPTPLMVTEGLPVPCSACYENEIPSYAENDRPRTSTAPTSAPSSHSTAAMRDALVKMNSASSRSASLPASEQEVQTHRAAVLRSSHMPAASTSAIETPPESPRRSHETSSAPSTEKAPRDSGFRKTYPDVSTKRSGPCESCAMTLPRRQDLQEKSTMSKTQMPLRTRMPHARVYGDGALAGNTTPPEAQTPPSSDTDGDETTRPSHRRTNTASSVSRSSASSTSRTNTHTHYVDYTSTHEPLVPTSYSIVRASCLRTLSFETLPRHPSAATASLATAPNLSPQTPGFVTTLSTGVAISGGPLFFGDPLAGYTTAYIFRIPDVHARGHKRVYAFLALSTYKERLAMKTFNFLSAAFRDLAAWIQQLAEAEAERAAEASPIVGPGYGGGFGEPSPRIPDTSDRDSRRGIGSSFLSGGSGLTRRMAGGFAGSGMSPKARGLPELVGRPDFFIELHQRFVCLLLELGVILNS